MLLGIPLLPEEEAALRQRQATLMELATAAKAYAETVPDESGGVFIDQPTQVVIAMFVANAEFHRRAITSALGKVGPLDVRQVRYSEVELSTLADRVVRDWEWMRDVQAAPRSATVEIQSNRVTLQISSANVAAEAAVRDHYGVPADMLSVQSDGTGVFFKPRGVIQGTVRTAQGEAPGPNELIVRWEPDGEGECGRLDAALGVDEDGTFELPCTPGAWTMRIESLPAGADWVTVGSGRASVPSGGTVNLVIDLAGFQVGGYVPAPGRARLLDDRVIV